MHTFRKLPMHVPNTKTKTDVRNGRGNSFIEKGKDMNRTLSKAR